MELDDGSSTERYWFRPDDENDAKEPENEEEKKMKEFFFLVNQPIPLTLSSIY